MLTSHLLIRNENQSPDSGLNSFKRRAAWARENAADATLHHNEASSSAVTPSTCEVTLEPLMDQTELERVADDAVSAALYHREPASSAATATTRGVTLAGISSSSAVRHGPIPAETGLLPHRTTITRATGLVGSSTSSCSSLPPSRVPGGTSSPISSINNSIASPQTSTPTDANPGLPPPLPVGAAVTPAPPSAASSSDSSNSSSRLTRAASFVPDDEDEDDHYFNETEKREQEVPLPKRHLSIRVAGEGFVSHPLVKR